MSSFTAEVYQNEFLPLDGSEVNAIVTVSSSGSAGMPESPGVPRGSAGSGGSGESGESEPARAGSPTPPRS